MGCAGSAQKGGAIVSQNERQQHDREPPSRDDDLDSWQLAIALAEWEFKRRPYVEEEA